MKTFEGSNNTKICKSKECERSCGNWQKYYPLLRYEEDRSHWSKSIANTNDNLISIYLNMSLNFIQFVNIFESLFNFRITC
jgi:hypothetical protein